jgi:hypothetical protein
MHRLSLSDNGVILDLSLNRIFENFGNFESDSAIINQNHRSNGHTVAEALVSGGELHIISFHLLVSDNSESGSSLEGNGLRISKVSRGDSGTLGEHHGGAFSVRSLLESISDVFELLAVRLRK